MRKFLAAMIVAAAFVRPALALDRAAVEKLALGDGDEKIEAIRLLLEQIAATLEVRSSSKELRIAAIRTLGRSSNPSVKTLLLEVLQIEEEEDILLELRTSLRSVESRLGWNQRAGLLFAGVS